MSTEKGKLLTFLVEKQWLALPVSSLSEVVTPQLRTPMPLSPHAVNGLINLRGRILTEIDVRRTLGMAPFDGDTRSCRVIILDEVEKEGFGLAVDRVGEVIDMAADDFERTPDSLDRKWRQVSYGVLKQQGRIVVLLDVGKLLALSMPEGGF